MAGADNEEERAGDLPRMLGRYHVLEVLGEDPLGLLLLARFEGPNGFQRWASVRRMHAHLAADDDLVQAFYEGARLAARVQHPNVATTFDVSEGDVPPWIALEYVHGESVVDLLEQAIATKRPVPWDIACRVVSDAALGVQAIAELEKADGRSSRLPHGPVPPSRLVITYDGKAKIFEGCLPALQGPHLLPYASPERTRGVSDVCSDVFGLGVLLWEMVAGRRLFAGSSESETAALLEAHVVPPLGRFARCPGKLDGIVRRALARDRDERFPAASPLARALQEVVVEKNLVLTDQEVAQYLHGIFGDRFEERQTRLQAAANITEVFRREDLPPIPPEPDTVQDVTSVESGAPEAPLSEAEAPRPAFVNALREELELGRPKLPPLPTVTLPEPRPRGGIWFVLLAVAGFVVAAALFERSLGQPPALRASSSGALPASAPRPSASPSVSMSVTRSIAPPLAPPIAPIAVPRTPIPTALATDLPIAPPARPTRSSSASRVPSPAPALPAAPVTPDVSDVPTPVSPPVRGGGLVTVICSPACDDVLDGARSLGPSPVFKAGLAAGPHHLILRVTDPAVEKGVDINVVAGETTLLKESMRK